MVEAETPKGVVVVLMPVGRDAATVAGLIERTGLRAVICHTVRDVVDHLERIIDVVLVAGKRYTAVMSMISRTGSTASRSGLINLLSYSLIIMKVPSLPRSDASWSCACATSTFSSARYRP
jgi:hypothetical protein